MVKRKISGQKPSLRVIQSFSGTVLIMHVRVTCTYVYIYISFLSHIVIPMHGQIYKSQVELDGVSTCCHYVEGSVLQDWICNVISKNLFGRTCWVWTILSWMSFIQAWSDKIIKVIKDLSKLDRYGTDKELREVWCTTAISTAGFPVPGLLIAKAHTNSAQQGQVLGSLFLIKQGFYHFGVCHLLLFLPPSQVPLPLHTTVAWITMYFPSSVPFSPHEEKKKVSIYQTWGEQHFIFPSAVRFKA